MCVCVCKCMTGCNDDMYLLMTSNMIWCEVEALNIKMHVKLRKRFSKLFESS